MTPRPDHLPTLPAHPSLARARPARIRHDAAHVLAEAAKELYPDVQVTIGPAIEDGFYYDFARDAGDHAPIRDVPPLQRCPRYDHGGRKARKEDGEVSVG